MNHIFSFVLAMGFTLLGGSVFAAMALAGLLLGAPASAVTPDWVTVGDPGNAGDTEVMWQDGTTGYGSVGYVYRISKYEVTNAQYAEFLNAKAASDPNGLYNTNMGSGFGGITRSGSDGSYTYISVGGREDMPVNYVSFYDALRFANWLHNGQGSGDTETGAYTITAQGIEDNSITRNPGATIFLPSEDEWYKAAYFNGMSYFDYPAGTDAPTVCAAPGATANTANCGNPSVVGDLTDVGSYAGSPSPYGTFDQGGNVFEWNEAIIAEPPDEDFIAEPPHENFTDGQFRGTRGGSFTNLPHNLAASDRAIFILPGKALELLGFRVASVPEPAVVTIDIDIKPGSDPNALNPFSRGLIPVAILGTQEFDVAAVDTTTLAFGPEGASLAHRNGPHHQDVNGDGLTDLLGHYRTEETGIALGDEEACITGEMLGSTLIEGCDSIRTVPACGVGFELALILPGVMWLRRRRLH